jgi:hypothetical protein
MGTTVLSPKIKRPEREADRLPPSTAKVKNVQDCTSAPAFVLMAFRGITITITINITITFVCILYCTV